MSTIKGFSAKFRCPNLEGEACIAKVREALTGAPGVYGFRVDPADKTVIVDCVDETACEAARAMLTVMGMEPIPVAKPVSS
ncbi:MAG: heavy metal-associated domain-containing protein [Fimbriimonadaceae bacterium]